jgi:hypothetical protein
LANAAEFLAGKAFALGVGSDLVDAIAIAAGKLQVVTETARKYLEIVREFCKNKVEISVLFFATEKVAVFSPCLPRTPPQVHHNLPPRCTTKSSKTPAKTHSYHIRKSTEKAVQKSWSGPRPGDPKQRLPDGKGALQLRDGGVRRQSLP